jgi:hypothetical protein
MKLPASKRKEIQKKGASVPAKPPGGGAQARVEQFEKQRGIRRRRTAKRTGDKE